MNYLIDFSYAIVTLLVEMSPYLLLGFAFAGLLSVLVSQEKIESQIGRQGFLSNLKAVLYGIPLPLCSCGVIPVSASLKRHGASKGSIISFLVATPQTGIDSILATYGVLGVPILIFKLIVALLSGLVAGSLSDIYDKDKEEKKRTSCADECCDDEKNIILKGFNYGFKTLPKDIAEPLIVGIVLSGVIAFLANFESIQSAIAVIPNNFGGTIIKILIAMSFSIPMYICATASVPLAYVIATSLGSPGAAVALLIAGPATNISTITTTLKIVGRKSTLIYIGTVIAFGFIGGIIADLMSLQFAAKPHHHDHGISLISLIYIFSLIGILFVALIGKKTIEKTSESISLKVKGMTCSHCESNVIKALMSLNGSKKIIANHNTDEVIIDSDNFNLSKIKSVLKELNYDFIGIND
tara:strand:- start:11424 stop:12656 length:1233 start_codon:yes stop_codon:yes gene_type:complete